MTDDYLPEVKTEARTVAAGSSFDLAFSVGGSGWIVAGASVEDVSGLLSGTANPEERETLELRAPHTIDLYAPGMPSPVATHASQIGESFITYDVPPGSAGSPSDWRVRVTNRGDRARPFSVRVRYPGPIQLDELRISAETLAAILNAILSSTKIHLTRGWNASSVTLPPSLRPEPFRFTIPDYYSDSWWRPAVTAYFHDLSSNGISFALIDSSAASTKGNLRFHVWFEERGPEIQGTFSIELSQMNLRADLRLFAQNGMPSYYDTIVVFKFDANVDDWPDFMFGNYEEDIRRRVEHALTSVLERQSTRDGFSEVAMNLIRSQLPSGARIADLAVENQELVLKYHQPLLQPRGPIAVSDGQ